MIKPPAAAAWNCVYKPGLLSAEMLATARQIPKSSANDSSAELELYIKLVAQNLE